MQTRADLKTAYDAQLSALEARFVVQLEEIRAQEAPSVPERLVRQNSAVRNHAVYMYCTATVTL